MRTRAPASGEVKFHPPLDSVAADAPMDMLTEDYMARDLCFLDLRDLEQMAERFGNPCFGVEAREGTRRWIRSEGSSGG